VLNLDELLSPFSDERPAGAECSYTLKFQEIGSLCEYLGLRAEIEELKRRERMPYSGENAESDQRFARDSLAAAEERHKQAVARVREITGKAATPALAAEEAEARCLELLKGTGKDLAVAQLLALVELQLQGVPGLAQVLSLCERLLDTWPAELYPQADEYDPEDHSARAMLVAEIANGDAFLHLLRESVAVRSGAGSMSFRDAEVLDDAIEPDPTGGGLSGPAHLQAIVRVHAAQALQRDPSLIDDETLRQQFKSLREPLSEAEATLQRLIDRFGNSIASGNRVLTLLRRATRRLSMEEEQLGAAGALSAVNAALGTDSSPVAMNGAPAQTAGGRLASREDARRMILEIAAYLERAEPGHPSPLFLRRAERLLGAASFFDIVKDMAPESIAEVERITGHKVPESDAS